MAHQLRLFLLALQFFTRIPVTGRLAQWVGFNTEMLRASSAYFPLVGALVGGLSAVVLLGFAAMLGLSHFGALIAAALSAGFGLLITGAFHEDGLADVADGLGGSPERQRALDIMRDSRIGAFGAAALGMALLVKVLLLAQLLLLLLAESQARTTLSLVLAVVASHSLSRLAALWLIALLPHVGDAATSKSKPLADQMPASSLWIANLTCFMLLVCVFIEFNAIIFASIIAVPAGLAWCMMRWFKRRLGGFTGDCLGATQQVCELGILLAFVAWLA